MIPLDIHGLIKFSNQVRINHDRSHDEINDSRSICGFVVPQEILALGFPVDDRFYLTLEG